MKYYVLLGFLLFSVAQCYAQLNQDKLFYLEKTEKYRRMKRTGSVLTIGGGVLMVVGLVTMVNSSSTTTSTGYGQSYTSTGGNPALGAVGYVLGSAGLGAGIPLWIIGGNNERKYRRLMESASVGIKVDPYSKGLSITWRL